MYCLLMSIAEQYVYIVFCGGLKTTNQKIITNLINTTMKKITEYVVAGVKADNEKVFMQRVGELLERKNLLDFLTEGVPIMVRIFDADELLKHVISLGGGSCSKACEILGAEIDSDFNIRINFRYLYESYWFKTTEDRDSWEKDAWSFNNKGGQKSKEMSEEFSVSGVRYSTNYCSVQKDAPGIDVALI